MRSWRNWQTRYFEGVVLTRCMGSSPIDRTIEDQKAMHVQACIVFSLYLENPRFDRGFSYLIGMSLQRNEKALL